MGCACVHMLMLVCVCAKVAGNLSRGVRLSFSFPGTKMKTLPPPFLLRPNYGSYHYQQFIFFLRCLMEDDEWRRRLIRRGSPRKCSGVSTERGQLYPLIAALGGRLHRAADTCPVRLALHMYRADLRTRGISLLPSPSLTSYTVNTSFSHPRLLISVSSSTFSRLGSFDLL